MGVIKRQSIKQTLVNFTFVFVAAFSSIFIYPNDRETYGLVQFLIGTSLFLYPFIMLGMNQVVVRFFPAFRDQEKGHNGMLGAASLVVLTGSILFMLSFVVFEEQIKDWSREKDPLFIEYIWYLGPLTFLQSFFMLLSIYCSNFRRIVIPSLFRNMIKITLPVLIVLYFTNLIPLIWVVRGVLIHYTVMVLGVLIYLYLLGQWYWKPNWSFFTKERIREIAKYGLFGILMSTGAAMAFRIDSFMISTLIDFNNNGTYNISLFIGGAIAIPGTAIMEIAAPIISDAFQRKDIPHIRMVYKKSSINLMIAGLYLLSGVLLCISDLYDLMPGDDGVREGLFVVVFIGLAKLTSMATSVNNQIINYSDHYRFGLYAILILAICNILLNLWLIPLLGITGAALATFLSVTLYNTAKLIFIYQRWRMQPFSIETVKVVLLAAVIFYTIYVIPFSGGAVLRILQKGILLTIVFVPAVYFMKISEDLNELVHKFLQSRR